MDYTTTGFLRAVKRLTTMPGASAQTFTNQQLYDIADREIASALFPMLNRLMQEFGVYVHDFPIQVGKAKYRIPARAWGSKLRDIKYVDVAGNEVLLRQVFPDEARNHQLQQATQPIQYTIQANSIILWPTPDSDVGHIRMRYYVRPNSLVDVSKAGTIVSIAAQTLEVTGPVGWAAEDGFDALKATPGFEHVLLDVVPTAFSFDGVGTYTITVGPDVDLSELEVGDYWCIAGETPVPQLPADMHPTLYQRVAARVQELQGDSQAMANANGQLALLEENLKVLHAPRVESARFVLNQYWLDNVV